MLPYIILIVISTAIFASHSFIRNENVNKCTAFVWVLIMTAFVGSQDSLGTDYINYIAQIKDSNVLPAEPFTMLMFFLIRNFFLPVQAFFYAYAALTYLFIAKSSFLINRANRILVIILVFQIGLFFQSFNIVRQILACVVFLYGIMLTVSDKKGTPYLLIACLIHYSAFFGLLFYLISRRFKANTLLFFIFLITILFLIIGSPIALLITFLQLFLRSSFYSYYLDSDLILEDNSVGFGLVLLITYSLLLYAYTKRIYFNVHYNGLLNISLVGVSVYNLLSSNVTMLRISFYLYFTLIFIIPLSMNTIPVLWRSRIILLVYFIYLSFIIVYLNADECPFVPYRSVLY